MGPILEDHEGTIWVGAIGVGTPGLLCAIRGGKTQCYGQDGSLGSVVLSLYEDGDRQSLGRRSFRALALETRTLRSVMRCQTQNLRSLLQGDDGKLLIGTPGGVMQLVNGKAVPYRIGGVAAPRSRQPAVPGSRWRSVDRNAGARGCSMSTRAEPTYFRGATDSPPTTSSALFEDREGNIWVATSEGLDRFRELPVVTVSGEQGLSTDAVLSVLAAKDGSVWLPGANGLDRWKNGQVTTLPKAGWTAR